MIASAAAMRRAARQRRLDVWRKGMGPGDQFGVGEGRKHDSLAGLGSGRSTRGRAGRARAQGSSDASAFLPSPGALPRLIAPMSRVWSPLARLPRLPALLVAVAGLAAGPALADPVRLVAADARGVTVQVTVGAWTLTAPDRDGRVRVNRMDGAYELGEPGRPVLPAFAATIAIPPGARPSARVVASDGQQARENVAFVIAGKPTFREDPDGRMGLQPVVDPQPAIVDGPWPASSIQLAPTFGFRGRRFVQLEVRPFRYDESSHRVSSPLTITVRVDFNVSSASSSLLSGLTAARDPQIDAALEGSVLNWEQGQGWRVTPAPERSRPGRSLLSSTGAAPGFAFDETQPEVRVKLDESAVYRIPFDSLTTYGYPDGVPVGEVSVHRHEFLEGASPPYGTLEMPSEVEDANANGVFDSGDGVWVWVQNWAERSKASVVQRWWGDAEVVFVTSKPGGGLRVPQRAAWNGAATTALPSFPWRRHFEKDLARMMQFVPSEVDTNFGVWHWTIQSLYYQRPDTMRFELNNIDTTHTVQFRARWVGRNFDTHVMFAVVK